MRWSLAPAAAIITGLAAPLAHAISEEEQAISGAIVIHDECAHLSPELATRTAPMYEAWRHRNERVIARLEGNADYQAQLKRDQRSIEDARAKSANDPSKLPESEDWCEALFEALFQDPSSARSMPDVAPADPHEAWNGFLAAIRSGDAEKALAYISPGSRGKYRRVFRQVGSKGMHKAAEQFGEMDRYQAAGDVAFGYFVRVGSDGTRQAFEVTFMRDPRTGAWLIESM